MTKVYKDPPYSGWREFIMWVGMTPLIIAGLIVGKRYFNRVLHEMDSMDFYIKPDTPGFEKGWVEEEDDERLQKGRVQ